MKRKRIKLFSSLLSMTLLLGIIPTQAYAVTGDEVIKDGTYFSIATQKTRKDHILLTITVTDGKITEITGSGSYSNKTYLNKALNGNVAKKQPGVCEQLIGKDATYNNVTNIDAVSGATKAINAIKEGLGEAFEQEKDYNKAYVGPTSGFDTIQETYATTEKMSQVEQMIFRATTYIGGEGQTTGFMVPATVKSISSGKYSSSGSTLKNVNIITSHGSGENTCITFPTGIDVTVEKINFGNGKSTPDVNVLVQSGAKVCFKDSTFKGAVTIEDGAEVTFENCTMTGNGLRYPEEGVTFTNTSVSTYVLMNIPYQAFYAAEKNLGETAAPVDAVSSATLNKTRSTLAAGSYHVNQDGSDISGVIYPVKVDDMSILNGFTQVTDSDEVTISVNLRGQTTETTYRGREVLFERPSYSYYILPITELPTSFKTLSIGGEEVSFGASTARPQEFTESTAELSTGGRHTYYELAISGAAEIKTDNVSAVTLRTTDHNVYGLRHVSEIWRGTELGFDDTGIYAALQGQTIDRITYYLNDGTARYISTNITVPYSSRGASVSVADAGNTAMETTVTTAGLPEGFVSSYAVTKGDEDLSEFKFTVADGKLTWEGTPAFGVYTLTVSDGDGKYAPVSTTFELKTSDVYAKYDAAGKALVKASDEITDEQFAAYLNAISTVSVDGTDYAASGKNAVKIIQDNGAVNMTATPFTKGDGATYSVVVKATGYPDLTFSIVTPRKSSGSSSGSSSSNSYAVSAPSTKNGDVTVSPKNAKKGDTVTITVTPDKGYELDTITVKDASGNKLKLTDKGNGKYTFTMPASKVTVSAEFVEEQAASTFADVPTDAYYAKAVEWAVKNGITNGKDNGLFGSNDPCTRGQIVTFLWRAAGSPAPQGTATVPADVLPGSYSYNAVAWALENGITNGLADGTFGVNNTCTRGQSVTFLYRTMGTAPSTVNGFTDVAADSFCAGAVAWAVENGVTNGTSATTFSPVDGCTRAQIVTFLYRAYQGK